MTRRPAAHRANDIRALLQRSIRSRPRLWVTVGIIALLLLWLILPPPAIVRSPRGQLAVQVTDRNGKPLYEVRDAESGSSVHAALSEIPQAIIDAFIAVEDRDFYQHGGFSIPAIARAFWQNMTAGKVVSGASTITQQLVRFRVQPQQRNLLWKAREALLAWKLENYRSKEEILESYLNEVYFGRQAYGVAAAARTYFDVRPHELSLAQSALLAGLVQSPVALDPFRDPRAAKQRQQRVLAAMLAAQVISQEAYLEAIDEPLTYARGAVKIRAPHFVQWLRSIRRDAFTRSGTVRTTIDLGLQEEAERIVEQKLAMLSEQRVTSAAVVVLDARTGELLAMVGSADYFDEEHDGAVNVAVSPRQPGSALKPFTYALALQRGDTAATTVADIETQFFTQNGNPYIPRNYDYGYHGLVRYREALANSYNIAAVRVLEKVGVQQLMTLLRAAGISTLQRTPEHYGLALTLGDAEVTLLDLTAAYGMFARGGEPLCVRVLPEDPQIRAEPILKPQIAWLITDILSDQHARFPEFGDASPLNFDWPVAAKTGTTRNSRDNWTVGYTPDVVVGVWVGNADNTPMRGTSGVTGAGPIFHDVMRAAAGRTSRASFPRPTGFVQQTICALSGKLPTPACPHTVDEWFIEGTVPTEKDDIFKVFAIDRRNGLLAGDACDPSVRTEKVFAVFPAELTLWARENGWESPPKEGSPLCGTVSSSASSSRPAVWLRIVDPQPLDSFRLDPLIPDRNEKIIFQAEAQGIDRMEWFVDGERVGTAKAPSFRFDWQPKIGTVTVEARGGGLTEKRSIEVIR